jgi:hypothetical protein
MVGLPGFLATRDRHSASDRTSSTLREVESPFPHRNGPDIVLNVGRIGTVSA